MKAILSACALFLVATLAAVADPTSSPPVTVRGVAVDTNGVIVSPSGVIGLASNLNARGHSVTNLLDVELANGTRLSAVDGRFVMATNGVAKDSTGATAASLGERLLWDASEVYAIDWQNRYLQQDGGQIVANWNEYALIGSGATTTVYWNAQALWSETGGVGIPSVDWLARIFYDSAANPVLDWSGANGTLGLPAIWSIFSNGNQVMGNSSGNTLYSDWTLYNGSLFGYNNGILNINNGTLAWSSSFVELDWQNRKLGTDINGFIEGTTPGVTVDWGSGYLFSPLDALKTLDWSGRMLIGGGWVAWDSADAYPSADFGAQTLSTGGNTALDWVYRELHDTAGTAVASWIDALRVIPSTSAPASPDAGDLWFDSNTGVNKLKCYDGTTWQACW